MTWEAPSAHGTCQDPQGNLGKSFPSLSCPSLSLQLEMGKLPPRVLGSQTALLENNLHMGPPLG